jgi:methylthioxylose transferase
MDEAIAISNRSAANALRTRRLDVPIALGGYAALVVAAFAWGRSLAASGAGIAINAPPLFGRFDARVSLRVIPVAIVAVAAVAYLPKLAAHLKFSRLLMVSVIAAFLWAGALAFVDGFDGFLGALEGPRDYLAAVPLVDSPVSFLSDFTENLGSFPLHVQAHPPGTLLFLGGLDALGLSGTGWAALAIVLAGASATAAVLLAVREFAGEQRARACAPFLTVGPAAIWIATSADALFMALSAWGIALFVLATGRGDVAGDVLAGAAGLVLGVSLFFSYGVAPLGLVVVAAAVARRRVRPLLIVGGGVVLVAATSAVLGFWWPEGLAGTIERYEAGIAARRPYGFFLVNNLAAFAVALGPAIAVALMRLRDRWLWVLVGATLVAVAAADLSGLSKGEVERIWLPFVPWVVVATAALENPRRLLALQAGAAIAIGVVVMTPW